ncbi:MAG: alpha/beta hydrolase [Oscillatoria sp. PMC 1051.18]|nr:alpha/beta hydrolase [Oscillatoria sp. PMC 1050.18]MEC5029160.1 alpha/beta hydrolase [Oscillatoria sp. PMC 1051.18]
MQDWWQITFPKGRQTLEITDANGDLVKIAYGEKGIGKPIILVHGIGSWSYGWRYLIEPLAKNFRVICFDAKGYGFSHKSNKLEKPGHQVTELQQIIAKLCSEPAVVIGQSLGGLITLAAAGENPDLFARLVVINPAIFPDDLPSFAMRILANIPLELIQTLDRWRLISPVAPLAREIIKFARREVVTNPEKITDEEIYWISYPYIEFEGAIAKYVEELQISLREISYLQRKQPNLLTKVQDNLPNLTIPSLILWGDGDRWFPVSHGEKLHSLLPNSHLEILPNCGHDAAGSCPELIYQAIVSFLAETDFEDNLKRR